MGSSKRKASFRIDDILQNQLQEVGAIRHPSTVPLQDINSSGGDLETPASHGSPAVGMSSNKESNKVNSTHNGSSAVATVEPPYSSPGSLEGAPRKPHPIYPPFQDLQKQASNFYLPLGLGMPQFSPAAYLEQYASALQKGKIHISEEKL